MTALENVFAEPILQALGWTLIHFIWQGVLLVALTASLNGMLGGRRANTRYLVVCAAMLLMLALPIATFCIIRSSSHVEAVSLQMIQEAQGESQTFFTATWPLAATASQPQALTFYDRLRPLLPWLISLWFMGVVALSLRLLFGWKYAQYLKARTTRSVSQWYEDMFADLCWKLRVSRPVRLLESAIVEVPTVIGWLKPVLLLPTSALTGLTPQQLEAILAHELAHIRRHDYLVNLLQSVVEVLLFYHPGVWWVSKQIRAERENCCDDMAVTVCGDMLTYTRALTQMEKLRGVRREFALAANGGDLLMRIQRLAQGPAPRATHSGWLLIIVAAIAAVITVGARPGSMSNSAGTDIARPAAEAFAPQDRLPLSKADYKASGSQSFAKVDQNKLFDASSQNAPIQQVAFTQANGERARKQDQASEAVTSLFAALTSRDWSVEGDVKEALNQISMSGTIEPLVAALKDSDWHIREKAAWSLGQLQDSRAVEGLIAAWRAENSDAKHTMSWALGMIGGDKAVAHLIEELNDSSPDARRAAAWALGMIGDRRAVDPLIALLKDSASEGRHAAAHALGLIGDARAVEPLRPLLNDDNRLVRQKAAWALSKLQ